MPEEWRCADLALLPLLEETAAYRTALARGMRLPFADAWRLEQRHYFLFELPLAGGEHLAYVLFLLDGESRQLTHALVITPDEEGNNALVQDLCRPDWAEVVSLTEGTPPL